jgi:hypothetical protein
MFAKEVKSRKASAFLIMDSAIYVHQPTLIKIKYSPQAQLAGKQWKPHNGQSFELKVTYHNNLRCPLKV